MNVQNKEYNFSPHLSHDSFLKKLQLELAFNPEKDFAKWKNAVGKKFRELLGFDSFKAVAPNLRIEYEKEAYSFKEIRFVFSSEEKVDVPCHLIIPKDTELPCPVIICLQGHSPGMHISLGKAKYEGDERSIAEDRDFAMQAMSRGFAALVLEQRCFGERSDSRPPERHIFHDRCTHAGMVELLLGRTMIGARIWDICRAIDILNQFPDIDTSRIGCMGDSGGGTATYFAACIDQRIKIAMPACYFCTFSDSIARIDHCVDNYIPGILKYFEMAELSCLIAPRPIIIVAGEEDKIFPIEGTKKAYKTLQSIYKKAGAPNKCKLIICKGGHRFYAKEAWPEFIELSGWAGANPSISAFRS